MCWPLDGPEKEYLMVHPCHLFTFRPVHEVNDPKEEDDKMSGIWGLRCIRWRLPCIWQASCKSLSQPLTFWITSGSPGGHAEGYQHWVTWPKSEHSAPILLWPRESQINEPLYFSHITIGLGEMWKHIWLCFELISKRIILMKKSAQGFLKLISLNY